jgi:hypothetical protein
MVLNQTIKIFCLYKILGVLNEKRCKEKNGKCENTLYKKCLRKLSYYFEFPINYIFYPLLQKRYYSQSIMGKIQQLIPISYYNND